MDTELDLARVLGERLDRGESGIVTSVPGMGRTHLLGRLAGRVRATRAWMIHGADRVETIPLVPFAEVFDEMGVDNADPLGIYTSFPRAIAGTSCVFLVDDADLLDQASAVLLTQMSRAGVAMVLSSSSIDTLPPALRERASSTDWWFETLEPLIDSDVVRLAEELDGAPLDAPTVAALLARARGNPGVVTELLRGSGARAEMGEESAHRTRFPLSPAVLRLVGVSLEVLNEDARRTAESVAVAGHLPSAVLNPAALGALVGARLVVERDALVFPTDPLVADIIVNEIEPHRRPVIAASAAAMIADLPEHARHHRDLLALAGHPQSPADVVAAAFSLTSDGRSGEAYGLLTATSLTTLGSDWAFDRSLATAAALVDLGRLGEALTFLDGAAVAAATDAELVRVAEHWTLVLSGRADDDEALEVRIAGIVDRIVDDEVRESVETGLARRRAILGERRPGGEPRGSDESDAVLRALRESMGGSLKTAREIAEPSLEGLAGDNVDLDGLLRVLAQFLTMVYDGDLGHAREVAETHYSRCAREGRPALGLWTYNRAKMAFHAGQYTESAARAEEAIRHLEWRDVVGQAVPADVMYAAALARLGHQDRAESIVAALHEDDLLLPRVAIGAARVRAEKLWRGGDRRGAAGILQEAGQFAVDNGELFSGILAIDEAFMITPDDDLAGALRGFRGSSQLFDAYEVRAAALIKKDPVGLMEAAARLEELYQPGRAAHAWQAAARLWSSARRPVDVRRAQQNAVRVTSVWNAMAWPIESHDDHKLTARELDVARLASQRVRSKEIAEQLALSIRTVDNHLARAYRKLGVAGRDELAEALGYDL